MGEKASKKRTVASVCQNILMICGVITALTGALGGVVETFKNVLDDGEKGTVAEVPVITSHAPASASESIVIEQRVHGGAGKHVRVSKTVEVGNTPEDTSEVGTEGAEGAEPTFVGEEVAPALTFAPAPEETLGQVWKRLWGWMLGGGLSVISVIMLVGWFVNRKKEQEKE